jgi:hypothetical protein
MARMRSFLGSKSRPIRYIGFDHPKQEHYQICYLFDLKYLEKCNLFCTVDLLVKNKNILKLRCFMIKYLVDFHRKAMPLIILLVAEPILFQDFHVEYVNSNLLKC